jgi:uncharacterized membrane protein YkvI
VSFFFFFEDMCAVVAVACSGGALRIFWLPRAVAVVVAMCSHSVSQCVTVCVTVCHSVSQCVTVRITVCHSVSQVTTHDFDKSQTQHQRWQWQCQLSSV